MWFSAPELAVALLLTVVWVGGACSFARKKLCTSRICGVSVLIDKGGSGRGGGRADGRFEERALEKKLGELWFKVE